MSQTRGLLFEVTGQRAFFERRYVLAGVAAKLVRDDDIKAAVAAGGHGNRAKLIRALRKLKAQGMFLDPIEIE